jgi:hypothetical protein
MGSQTTPDSDLGFCLAAASCRSWRAGADEGVREAGQPKGEVMRIEGERHGIGNSILRLILTLAQRPSQAGNGSGSRSIGIGSRRDFFSMDNTLVKPLILLQVFSRLSPQRRIDAGTWKRAAIVCRDAAGLGTKKSRGSNI